MINNHVNSYSKPNAVRSTVKTFENNKKKLCNLGESWIQFTISGRIWIFIKNPSVPLFFKSGEALMCKISEKLTSGF